MSDKPRTCGECDEHLPETKAATKHVPAHDCKHFRIRCAASKAACRSPWAVKASDGAPVQEVLL